MTGNTTRILTRFGTIALLTSLLLGLPAERVLADGSETLGPPSIPIADGTGVIMAGTGLLLLQPDTIEYGDVDPATVRQVLVYWSGFGSPGDGLTDDTISVNGSTVIGTLIGGPDFFFEPGRNSSTFRADITDLLSPEEIASGQLSISGLNYNISNHGAGVVFVVDDGSATTVQLVDGNDNASSVQPPPRLDTVPQQFNFPPSSADRMATITGFFSSVEGTASGLGERPSTVVVTVGGEVVDGEVIGGVQTEFINLLDSNDGEEWDTLAVEVLVPAGETSLVVQPFSNDRADPPTGQLPASFVWSASVLELPPPVCSLGDLVFLDKNRDGIQDPEDPGIANVKLNLTRDCENLDGTSPDPDFMEMVRTNADGIYGFTDLLCGCKYIVEPDPCNFESGPGVSCPDGGTAGNLEDLVESPRDQGDGCNDSDAPMAMTVLTVEEPDDPCLDFGYVPPPPPDIIIEKFTNGYDADDADGFPVLTPPDGTFEVGGNQVPLVAVGDPITWTYVVQNTGPETLVNVTVTDDQGLMVACPQTTLEPGEEITCMAIGTGLDLDSNPDATIVDGCGAQGRGATQPTYENKGMVTAMGVTTGLLVEDNDPSHYCNPPDVMVEKFTNGHDGDDPNGIPTPGPGSGEPGDTTVAEVPSGDDILWTYEVTNNGDEALENVEVTDSRGVMLTCPQSTLVPGETITCTATGSADDLEMTGGDVDGCGAFGQGQTRPTYENMGRVVAQGTTSGVSVEDNDPSHYCNPPPPPPCGLTVQKACELPPPPPSADGKCEGKLQEFTMVWNGDGPIGITLGDGLTGSSASSADPGDEVTFFTDGSTNDTIVNISGAVSGQSTFHVSCSDKDMDGDTTTNEDQDQVAVPPGRDCGKDQGDGKGKSGFINQWLLEGFKDKNGDVLDCTFDGDGGEAVCEFNAIPADCDNPGKPENLTWLYSGGGCAASDNDQDSGDLFCDEFSGGINGSQAVTISDDDGNVFNVAPGGVFTTAREASKVFTLVNAGGTEENGRHVSCSQPLQAGDVYGSLTLVGLDGLGIGTNVTYSYVVSVASDAPGAVTNISVTDDQLGSIGAIASLQPGDSQTLTADAFISETTMNVATADGSGPPGSVCPAVDSSPVVVEVLPPPPCDVGIAFEKLEDSKIKWELTNNSVFGKATLQTFTLDFSASFDAVKKVKLDGDIYKADDSNLVVGPGVTIGENDWTQDDVTKRQLDQGETRTLEVEFEEKDQDATPSDFDLLLTFEEGCGVQFGDPNLLKGDAEIESNNTEGSGLGCSAARSDGEAPLGLLLFAGALLLWSRRRRRNVV